MRTNLNKQEQNGRSMVEMLGTLAIIGVLSIAGVAGYTSAMNKHKANEILNSALMRAMAVSAQLQADSSATPNLGEFTDNTVGSATFGNATKVGTSQFKINLSTPPEEDICNEIKNIAGTNGTIRSFGTKCESLTYNIDLTNTNPTPSDPSELKTKETCEAANFVWCPETYDAYLQGWYCDTASNCPRTEADCKAKGYHWKRECGGTVYYCTDEQIPC